MKSQVVDVIPFFNEIDLLEIRLNVLNEKVDKFIISEFTTSFAGNYKGLNFLKHQERFEKFREKIIYSPKQHVPTSDPFLNDRHQKDAIVDDIATHLSDDAIILFGDLDEIPNPNKIEFAIHSINNGYRISHFAQDPFYGFLNMRDISGKLLSFAGEYPRVYRKKWIGTIVSTRNYAMSQGMTNLRNPDQKNVGKRIRNGGWHFSYCGGLNQDFEERISTKIRHNAHQEFNNKKIIDGISKRLESQEDILGRTSKNIFGKQKIAKLKPVNIDGTFPEYLISNQDKYRHLIYDCN
jgi:beta-1,4-mannosyl-glycoprotein beta-1,4-N-acetylglucosaminyltransferase